MSGTQRTEAARRQALFRGVLGLGAGALTGVQFVSQSRGWVVGLDQILSTSDGAALERPGPGQAPAHLGGLCR